MNPASNGRGACHDFRQFLGDRGLAGLVVDQLELVDHATGVVGRSFHGHHTRRLLGCHVLGDCLVDLGFQVTHQQLVDDRGGIGFVDVIPVVALLTLLQLAGERLTPPAPLPPEVFTTREVELARPMVRFASRDWALLDAEFAQRLLMVFRIMREQHGYEMVLIEGYRSPQRQEQLAAMGGHVTKVGAFRSYHQFGLAADSAFMRMGQVVISERDPWAMRGYELYGEVSASLGLTWGGGWKNLKDLGHVELRRPGVLRRAAREAPPAVGYAY